MKHLLFLRRSIDDHRPSNACSSLCSLEKITRPRAGAARANEELDAARRRVIERVEHADHGWRGGDTEWMRFEKTESGGETERRRNEE